MRPFHIQASHAFPGTSKILTLLFLILLTTLVGDARSGVSESSSVPDNSKYYKYDSMTSPFDSSFVLWYTDDVGAAWTSDDFEDFMEKVLDSDSTNSADVFPLLHEYFLWDGVDQDPSYEGLDIPGRIAIYLYTDGDTTDCPEFGNSCANVGWASYFVEGTGQEGAESKELAHEVAHVLWFANSLSGALWANEFHSTVAEYVTGHRWDDSVYPSNQFYDKTYLSNSTYFLTRLFSAYMMEHFSGNAGVEDDLAYNWAREAPNTGANRSMLQLGDVLDSLDNEFSGRYPSGVVGSTSSETAGNLYHRQAIARYANDNTYDGGTFGFGTGVSARDHKLFEWPDSNSFQVRSVAPHFTLGPDNADPGSPLVVSEFIGTGEHKPSQWSVDCRTRELGMRRWASEYIVLQSDPGYFIDGYGRSKTLNVTVKSTGSIDTTDYAVELGYIVYDASDSVLYDDNIVNVVERHAISFSGDTLATTITVPSFGDTAKSVVLVASLVDNPVSSYIGNCEDSYCNPAITGGVCWGCPGSGNCAEPTVYLELTCALGTLLDVGYEYETVQAAIDDAVPGDLVSISVEPSGITEDVDVDTPVTIRNDSGLPLGF